MVRLEQVLPLLLLVDEKKREVLEKKYSNSKSLENMIHITNLKDSFNLYDFLVSDLAEIEYKKEKDDIRL